MPHTDLSAPRQLDIIADTALAADPRLAIAKHTASSTVVARSHVEPKHTASSTVADAVDRADQARIRAGLSHSQWCRAAGLELNNWHKLRRGEQQPTAATLKKLEAAMGEQRQPKPIKLIAGFHRLVVGLCADAMGTDRDAVLGTDMTKQRPQNAAWLQAAQIQMMATYITAVELEVSNAELGRAIGQSRQAVQKARNRVEDLRDMPEVDAALVKVTAMVALR